MTPQDLTKSVKSKANSLGFSGIGVSATIQDRPKQFYEWWTDQGFAGEMFYLRSQKKRRANLHTVLPEAKSVVVCAVSFPIGTTAIPNDFNEKIYGKVARYAVNDDYHMRILPMLNGLASYLDEIAKPKNKSLAYVDTGPLSERAYAAQAGLGWIGKNSLLLNRELGSWFWLGEIVTQVELTPDSPTTDHCGNCRRCIDACPTQAILEDLRSVDARKCLAYWNIEHRGSIPQEFHKPMGEWLLGCDICQEVCPWNDQAARVQNGSPQAEWILVDELLKLTEEEFSLKYRKRAHARAKLAGLQRNAEIVQKNKTNCQR